MAKIQRLSMSTDQKMAMLRGQPGHMPTPAVATGPDAAAGPTPQPVDAEPAAAPVMPAEALVFPEPVVGTAPAPVRLDLVPAPVAPEPFTEAPSVPVAALAPVAATPYTPEAVSVALPARKGPGRPRKSDATPALTPTGAPAGALTTGLPPSLIRLEGAAQYAALSYIREEMLRGRRVYLKQLVDEAIQFYLQHGPPAQQG